MNRGKRAASKAAQILEGAKQAFYESGYDGASVDDIAAAAGVSKATIYKHFADKKALFAAMTREECETHGGHVFEVELKEEDVREALLKIARSYVNLILSDFAQSTFRLVVSETRQFPDIGRVFHDSAMGKGSQRLAHFLAGAVARGILDIDDIDLAAQQFLELCKADLFYKHLLGVKTEISKAEREHVVAKAVEVFWKAYAADQDGT
ncbi:TetR/AcrR family transcriptional regulator [Rhodobium gokarnense]|uniref:AcrR family transcriptional regulator n=1 Tax=Rhodobium gokarnense TaxID=364296 RepID=A0ABT3HBG7_9HYPH|nr:TetR/AcrR family transcriptional regulator [Rhodobium gokarnense]MCW2307742.1 AcrR family transcriptional regulator [Rhodobium gokarnense]